MELKKVNLILKNLCKPIRRDENVRHSICQRKPGKGKTEYQE